MRQQLFLDGVKPYTYLLINTTHFNCDEKVYVQVVDCASLAETYHNVDKIESALHLEVGWQMWDEDYGEGAVLIRVA